MIFDDKDKIKATIIYHLRRKRVIGGVHTNYDAITRGFLSHLGKEIKNTAKDLIKQGWLVTKPAHYGLQVSLNKEKIKEIDEFILKILNIKLAK